MKIMLCYLSVNAGLSILDSQVFPSLSLYCSTNLRYSLKCLMHTVQYQEYEKFVYSNFLSGLLLGVQWNHSNPSSTGSAFGNRKPCTNPSLLSWPRPKYL